MIYIATVGNKFKIKEFFEPVELRLNHKLIVAGKVFYHSEKTVKIETDLSYPVGQKVSIGGYPIGGKYFRLIELSVTEYPLLENAKIIERRSS